jgi:hypothetical protein
MLYEMITGQRPFGGDHDAAVVYSILKEKPKPIRSVRDSIPKELQWIVDKALAKRPEERYQTVGDLLSDLKEVQSGLASGERPNIKSRVSERARIRKLLFPAGATLLAAAAALAIRSLISPVTIDSGQKFLSFFYSLESPNPQVLGVFGHGVTGAGDVDNDRHEDVIVTAWREGGESQPGRVYVFSGYGGDLGYGGQLLNTLQSPNPEIRGVFGSSASAVGDVNGDGHADIIVGTEEDGGAWDAGTAYVFSGKDGGLLHALHSPNPQIHGWFGQSVSGVGDVDGDSMPDVMVSAPYENGGGKGPGRVHLFSGDEGLLLTTLVSPNAEANGRFSASTGAGDVNNDGYPDVVVGAIFEDGGAVDAGRAYVFSGNDGGLLYTLESPNPEYGGGFGGSVAAAGDVNSDGFPDLAVGAGREDGGAVDAGRAYVFSGNGGTLLYTLESPNPEYSGSFGTFLSGAGDVDADGYEDIIVAASNEDGGALEAGRAYVFGGYGGDPLCTLESPNPERGGSFGRSAVSGVGDVDNDGYDDVIVGAPHEGDTKNCGRAYIFTSAMSLWGDLVDGSLRFHWAGNTEAKEYWVYGATSSTSFEPGISPPYEHRLAALPHGTTTWSSPTGMGDPLENWTYMIVMVDSNASEIARSNRVRSGDFGVEMQ